MTYSNLFDDDFNDSLPARKKRSSSAEGLFYTLVTSLRALAVFLIPSFILNRISKQRTQRKLHATSWLDGLRGLAAVIVFIHHDVDFSAPWLNWAYGMHEFRSVMQLPFLRLWVSGQPMVHLFFVISGYVLSVKQVRYIRSGNFNKLSDSLFSSAFRRGFRLYLPSIAGFIFFEITIFLGLQGFNHDLFTRIRLLLYAWRWDAWEHRLLHLWTMPIEFSCSMLLFVVILALSRLRTPIRLAAVVILIANALAGGRWGPSEFLAGYLIAEVEELIEERNERREQDEKHDDRFYQDCVLDFWNDSFWIGALIVALYTAGWSKYEYTKVPLLRYLVPLIPDVYRLPNDDAGLSFIFPFTAIIIVWALFRLPALQAPFITGPIQYLGDISFSFYIVHNFLLVGWPRIWAAQYAIYLSGGRKTATRGLVSQFLEVAILFVCILWIADIFWRAVDQPCVRFSRWIEKLCRATEASSEPNNLRLVQ